MKIPTNYDSDRLYEIRKSFIEKISAWETRIFYAVILFMAFILSTLTFNNEILKKVSGYLKFNEFWTLGICYFLSIFLLSWLEYGSWKRIKDMHKKLINDLKSHNLDKIEEFSFCDYIKGKF